MYTYKNITTGVAAAFAVSIGFLSSCIKNDLPYPWVQPNVLEFSVSKTDAQGHSLLASPTAIDSAQRTVTITLTEWADISNVTVDKVTFSSGTELIEPAVIPASLNLSEPLKMTLSLYERNYEWTVTANQDIERYFTVGSQIGTSVINADDHTVMALVPKGQNLADIQVKSIKLAGPLATMQPDLAGQHVDFSEPVKVNVNEFGRSTEWTISVDVTDVSVEIDRVDAWTNVAWLYANAEAGKQNGFEFRRATADEWTVVPSDWITVAGGSFTACLRHLEAETEYVARAVSDNDHSAEVSFTTGKIVQLPNSDFTQWWKDGKVWNPWGENQTAFWGTGNRGAATLGESNTTPMQDASSPTGFSGAQLETRFVGVGVFGKIAAGNLFAGDYVRTDGTNGVLSFGREFVQRPTAIKARIKYITAPITHASASNPNFNYMKGEPDTCIVWCALADWSEPFEIRTKPSDRQLFNSGDPGVIAYGDVQSGASIESFTYVIFKLDYKATDRIPRYILLAASASKYGDYFTGGNGATLYVESVELLYDYE